MAECTSGSYLVRLPHTSARPNGGPGDGGGMGVCGGARLKAAIVMRQCRGFSQASPGCIIRAFPHFFFLIDQKDQVSRYREIRTRYLEDARA
jgi:hypothetical protein